MSHTEDVREQGASLTGTGSRPSDHALAGHGAPRFDPLRETEASRHAAPPGRLRKAYRIKLRGYDDTDIVYAPTPAKAKAIMFGHVSDVWSVSFKEFLAQVQYCVREPYRDVTLPDRHPLAAQISDKILHCVVHAYGGKGLKAGYRDHFYTSDRDHVMKAAYYHGLFDRYRVDPGRAGSRDMVMYELTTLGKNVARGEAETYPTF